jgi:cell division septal protein FtsQ
MKGRKRRGNSRYYLYFGLYLSAVLALGFGLWYAMRHLPFLEVKKIAISGNLAVPDSLITPFAEDQIGTNLFRVPTKDIASEIKTLSRIRDVKVHRRLFSTLRIHVSEREGIIYVKSREGVLYPIDGEATIMERYSPIYLEDIPIFSTYYNDSQLEYGSVLDKPEVFRILALHQSIIREAPDYLPIVSEYYMIDNTINIIDARYGTRIIPGDDDIATQLRRYQFVQDNGNIDRRSVVDLRFDNQVVVKAGDK